MATEVRIEAATVNDVPLLLTLIQALAEYERMSDQVLATEGRLRDTLRCGFTTIRHFSRSLGSISRTSSCCLTGVPGALVQRFCVTSLASRSNATAGG